MAKRKDLIMCTCPCHNEDERCEQCCDGAVGRRAIATEGALLHLRNEIHGSLEISDRNAKSAGQICDVLHGVSKRRTKF